MTMQRLHLALLCVWSLSEVLILLLTRTRGSTGTVHDRGSLRILWLAIVGSITCGTWFGEAHAHGILSGPHWLRPAALVVLVAGLAIRWTAIASLGRAFSANVAIHATQTLCTTGAYSIVRHPSYSGLLLVLLGIGLYTRNGVSIAIVVAPSVAALLYRIHVEEAALIAAFGKQYADYMRATRRLIPGIY